MELSQSFATPMSSQELRYNFTPGISPTAAAAAENIQMDVDDIDDDIDDDEKTIDLFFDEMTWIQYQQQQKQRDDDLNDFIPPQQVQETLPAVMIQEEQEVVVPLAAAADDAVEQDVAAAAAAAVAEQEAAAAAEQEAADAASLQRLFMQSVADAQQEEDAYPLSLTLPNGFIVSFGMVPAHRLPNLLQLISTSKSKISLQ